MSHDGRVFLKEIALMVGAPLVLAVALCAWFVPWQPFLDQVRAQSVAVEARPLAPGEIFREISLEPFGRVALDQPFTQQDTLAVKVGPRLYELPAGFGDTKAIRVELDSLDRVVSMYFVYVPGKDFNASRTSYIETLGAPVDTVEQDEVGVQIHRARWQDQRTFFELVSRAHPDSMPEVVSVLRSR